MATLNLQPFIATQNAFAKREERIPVWMHATRIGYQIPECLTELTNNLEQYMNGIRIFGYEKGRKEDGYGERTYHLKDLEEIVNIYRSIGLAKSLPDFLSDFDFNDGWSFVTMDIDQSVPDQVVRSVKINDGTLAAIALDIAEGRCSGLDCVDWSGVVHRNCQLIKISDLHPDTKAKHKVLDEVKQTYKEIEVVVPGVHSDMYLIITPECQEKGFIVPEGQTEATLQASPYLRSPIGFVLMRRSRLGDITTRFPKGTSLLKSMCPIQMEYHEFDQMLAKATLVIQDPKIPGVIYKAIAQHNNQATLTHEHFKAQNDVLDYILSPEDQEDGTANVHKGWLRLTGQHHAFNNILAEALQIFKAVPQVISESGARGGNDLQFELVKVVDIKFNTRWAIIEEFEAILNPNGAQSGLSSITAANPIPYYIHTLNPETKEWEKDPVNKWIFCDTRGRKWFSRGEDPFALIDVNELPDPYIKPLNDIHKRIEEQHAAIVASLKKDGKGA